jgi:hypothetical protein
MKRFFYRFSNWLVDNWDSYRNTFTAIMVASLLIGMVGFIVQDTMIIRVCVIAFVLNYIHLIIISSWVQGDYFKNIR